MFSKPFGGLWPEVVAWLGDLTSFNPTDMAKLSRMKLVQDLMDDVPSDVGGLEAWAIKAGVPMPADPLACLVEIHRTRLDHVDARLRENSERWLEAHGRAKPSA